MPRFQFSTSSDSTSNGSSDLDVATLVDSLCSDPDNVQALAHHAGGTFDNEPEALVTTKKSFEKIMIKIPEPLRYLNGVL